MKIPQIQKQMNDDNEIKKTREKPLKCWFPLFVSIEDKTFLVVGAGAVGKRRIKTLLKFNCSIKVIDPIDQNEFLWHEVYPFSDENRIFFIRKKYEEADLEDVDFVLACTDNIDINRRIYEDCKNRRIPVNVASDKNLCDFYFPGIVTDDSVTVGVTAEGTNHRVAKETIQIIESALNEKK